MKCKAVLVVVLIMVLSLLACSNQAKPTFAAQNDAVPDVPLPAGGNVKAVNQLPDKPLRIAFLSFQNNPFWFPVRDGALAAKEYLANYNTTVDYIVMGEDMTSDRVVAAMEGAIAKEYDAIAVIPLFDGTELVINRAVDEGIPVFNFIAEGAVPSKRLAFMGQDAMAAGRLMGETIEKMIGGSGKVGVISGVFGATQHEQRMHGATDYWEQSVPGIEVVGIYENRDRAETAYTLTKDMLTAHPDLKIVYVTAGGPFGAAKAIQDEGLTGKVGVVCYDHIPENLEYIRSGEIVAAVAQDPFGQGFDSNVYLYNYLVAGQKPPADFLPVKLDVCTPGNVEQMYPK